MRTPAGEDLVLLMSKLGKPTVSASASINVTLPDDYNVTGGNDLQSHTTVVEKPRSEEDEQFLEMLHAHLEGIEKQRQLTINMINIVKKRLGFCCGKG